jgi:histidine triad (HIT) family protein
MTDAPCIFCRIVAGQAPADVFWSDEQFLAFPVLHPIAPEHVVVIPRAHVASIHELDAATYGALFERVRLVAALVRRASQATEIGLAVEGLSVRHVHVHVLPVNRPGDLDPCRVQPSTEASRRAVADRLRSVSPAV